MALLPLWVGLLAWLLIKDYYRPMFRSPPEAIGLPAGLVLLLGAFLLTSFGLFAARGSHSRASAGLAFAFLTVPATLIVILTPAVVLILINLGPQSH